MSACTLAPCGRKPGMLPAREATRAAGSRSALGQLGVVLAVLVALGGGCAMQQKPTSTSPASAAREHGEVAELEKLIADHKASLHSAGDDRPAASDTATPMSAGAAPAPRCDGVCRAGQEICTASRRICKIAADLNESAITASCQRAERSCSDASALCAQCR